MLTLNLSENMSYCENYKFSLLTGFSLINNQSVSYVFVTTVNEVHELIAIVKVTEYQKCFIISLSWWIIFTAR